MIRIKKTVALAVFVLFGFTLQSTATDKPKGKQIPDIPGYYTLKCDLHIHTVFSDGKVWPTVRVQEALNEGLDAIALTDHTGKIKPNTDVIKNLDRAYDIAAKEAENTGLIVIKGGEITFPMPPGHFNAIFLSEAQKLETGDYMTSYEEAKKQDAFIFWNHSNWKSPDKKWEQDGIAGWHDLHTELLDKGILMGLEIVNHHYYNKEAHTWCIEKGLTMLANSDIHQPITFDYDLEEGHRPLTLVLAKERTEQGIKDALLNQRTVVWFEDNLIGDKKFLSPLFQECVKVEEVSYYEKIAKVTIQNTSAVDFILENKSDYSLLNKTKTFVLEAGQKMEIAVKTVEKLDEFELRFSVLNMLITPDKYLETELICKPR